MSRDFADVVEGLDAVGYGIAMWSDKQTLQYQNAVCEQFIREAGLSNFENLSFETLLNSMLATNMLMAPPNQQAWLDEEMRLFVIGGNSNYTTIDGRVFRNERWRLPKGGVSMLIRDITEETRSRNLIKQARSEADQSDQNKSRFLRAANHDLRQPLATLKILIYNCMMTDEEEHRADLLHAMDISVSIMEDLLGALLNIGQLDAGQVKPKISTFQISTLLDRLDIQFSHQAREKALDFRVVPSRYAVVSDRALLERVVGNLVANAIRYTERGAILIGCRRVGDKYRLEIRDSGHGIAPEHLTTIFDEFYQIEHSRKKQGALGLGLSIAKRISNILGHALDVKSRIGEGSIFSIELPIGDILQSDIGEPEINERIGGEFSNLSVLVLEDDESLRLALTELLERWGITVVAFNEFDNLVDRLEEMEFIPDLIITDFRLHGGLNGNDVVRSIRQSLKLDAPAIVVTADTSPELIDGIRGEGFPVLIKPVSPPRLRVMMHNILYEPNLVRELNLHDPDSGSDAP